MRGCTALPSKEASANTHLCTCIPFFRYSSNYTLKKSVRRLCRVDIEKHLLRTIHVRQSLGRKVRQTADNPNQMCDCFFRCIPTIQAFWKTHVVTQLQTSQLKKAEDGEEDSSTKRARGPNCECGKEDDGEMIRYDNTSCRYKWFYWRAMHGAEKAPAKKWYCRHCKKKKQQRK